MNNFSYIHVHTKKTVQSVEKDSSNYEDDMEEI